MAPEEKRRKKNMIDKALHRKLKNKQEKLE
jgi:hypothetical protein